jgi:acyl-coenzyme A thioesterase PaaI-like protein
MDLTRLAASLLEPIPANRTARIEVLRAAEGRAQVALTTSAELANVIGSLHSSGLITLADAAGLAAIITAGRTGEEFRDVTPLGRTASLEFLAPASGRLTATCRLGEETKQALRPFLERRTDRVRISTLAEITDEAGEVVCRGGFDWSLRRTA